MRQLALLPLVLSGCFLDNGGSSNRFAALYEAPTGTATGTIHGTWAGTAEGFDTRWVLAPNRLTLANKCGSRIVGVEVAAEVTTSTIRMLESKEAGTEACFVRTMPLAFVPCPTSPGSIQEKCFIHSMKSLTIHFDVFEEISLIKLTDSTTFGDPDDRETGGGDDSPPSP